VAYRLSPIASRCLKVCGHLQCAVRHEPQPSSGYGGLPV
jgi:hypothetical protein